MSGMSSELPLALMLLEQVFQQMVASQLRVLPLAHGSQQGKFGAVVGGNSQNIRWVRNAMTKENAFAAASSQRLLNPSLQL